MRMRCSTSVMAIAAVVVGCGGGSSGGDSSDGLSETVAASFEGIYELTEWTENESGCDGAGMDALAGATDLFFVLAGHEFFGLNTVELISCADVADCQGKVAALRGLRV